MQNRKSSPRWGGPLRNSDIDEAGVTVAFQSQTFKVARFCVRKRLEEKDVSDEERRNLVHRGDPGESQQLTGAPVAPTVDEVIGKPA